jgi:hypothetical protein
MRYNMMVLNARLDRDLELHMIHKFLLQSRPEFNSTLVPLICIYSAVEYLCSTYTTANISPMLPASFGPQHATRTVKLHRPYCPNADAITRTANQTTIHML